ncbi:hypothetical protein PV327_005858 [Microctonus hyperodae]|uniref:Uncharacterized protein n=1 Tax=Microctonus hyperodae TaxID=165561 RepID=A0AA39L054_MICHY|nr:hypothetical protein PV327_005858 [Microctonus hyperodae]
MSGLWRRENGEDTWVYTGGPKLLRDEDYAGAMNGLVGMKWFTLGITVPIITNKEGSLASNLGFQLNYVLPWNLTQLQPQIVISTREKKNDINLQHIYTTIENLLEKFGWNNGRQCLLRSICEIAETPLGTTSRDVVEEIIHLLLTPTEDLPEAVNSSHRSISKLYQEAERLGRSGGDCLFTYPDCIESPLESFTDIELF